MKKSIANRFKKTRTGKILRRAMSQGHLSSKKSSVQIKRRKHFRNIDDLGKKIAKKYL